MKNKLMFAFALVPFAAAAQGVPAINAGVSIPPPSSAQIRMNEKENAALRIARDWKNSPNKPRRSGDGTVIYLYGATLPTMICTMLRSCSIKLQMGELINDVKAGDDRFHLEPATLGELGSPTATPLVIVKPTDSGIESNLIIATNRRIYTIKLVAARHEWINMAFDYPDEQENTWANYRSQQGRVAHATTLSTGESLAGMDFGYKIGGDNPKWKPLRVFSGKGKTRIQFDPASISGDAPALVVYGRGGPIWSGDEPQMVNYRLSEAGDSYIVDLVIDRAALISGVGSAQTKVTIDYVGGKGQ